MAQGGGLGEPRHQGGAVLQSTPTHRQVPLSPTPLSPRTHLRRTAESNGNPTQVQGEALSELWDMVAGAL